MQGIWIEACRGLAELADVDGRRRPRREGARGRGAHAGRGREDVLARRTARFYAFATALAKPEKDYKAEPGPRRAERQARIDALRGHTIVDEDTVLPGVPLWWRVLDPAHAECRDRPPRLRGPGHGLGPAPPLREERALRPALVSLRLGVAAVHGLGLRGRVPIRPAPGRVPGPDGQRAPHLALARSATSRSCSPASSTRPSAARRITRSGRRRWW